MQEGQLLAMLRVAEQRLADLEYQISLLKQAAGRDENSVNIIRSAGAN